MSKGKWRMNISTDSSSDALKLSIVDTHHETAFYGEWTAYNLHDLDYHLSGLKDCIDQGIYRNIDFIFNGKRVGSFGEFEKKMYTFYDSQKKKATKAKAPAKTKTKAKAKPKSKLVVKSKAKPKAKTAARPKAKTTAKPKSKAKPKTTTRPKSGVKRKTAGKKTQAKVVKLNRKTQAKSKTRKAATSRKKAA